MVTTSMAALDVGAKRRQEWLYDIYQMARDAIRNNARETFIIPADQSDPGTAVKLVNVLRLGGVEIERATAPFNAGGKQYGAGSFVIHGAQPFEPYVKDLLTPQVYPDMRFFPGGPPKRPYDITGWTLSYQMGVRADRVAEAVNVAAEKIDVAPVPAASAPSQAKTYAVDPRANDAFIAVNRLLKAGDVVFRTRTPIAVGGTEWPAGTFLVTNGAGTAARVDQVARSLGLKVGAVDAPASGSDKGQTGVRHQSDPCPRAADRALSRLGRQHGRRVDALAARAVRVPVHAAFRSRRSRGKSACKIRRHPAARRHL
jgi:hypothetical protein